MTMKKSTSPQRATQASTVRSQDVSPIVPHSVPLAELESLLRMAHANTRPQIGTQEEVLGPGDVQYLRGETPSQLNANPSVSPSDNLETRQNPDILLQQAQQQLADAILDSGHPQTEVKSTVHHPIVDRVSSSSTTHPGVTLEDLADVDLDISIELGRAEILIEDILKLREGSIVSLDKLAGDPVDIVANGRLVARGELLVIDGKFGVRLSEVL